MFGSKLSMVTVAWKVISKVGTNIILRYSICTIKLITDLPYYFTAIIKKHAFHGL